MCLQQACLCHQHRHLSRQPALHTLLPVAALLPEQVEQQVSGEVLQPEQPPHPTPDTQGILHCSQPALEFLLQHGFIRCTFALQHSLHQVHPSAAVPRMCTSPQASTLTICLPGLLLLLQHLG